MGRLRRYKMVKITPTIETYEVIARNIKEAKNIILDRGLLLHKSIGDSTYEIIDVNELTDGDPYIL